MKKIFYSALVFLFAANSSFSQINPSFLDCGAIAPPDHPGCPIITMNNSSLNGRSVSLSFQEGEFACAYLINLKIVTRMPGGGYAEMQAPGYPVLIQHDPTSSIQEYDDFTLPQLANSLPGRNLFKYEIGAFNSYGGNLNGSNVSSSPIFAYTNGNRPQNTPAPMLPWFRP